MSKVKAIATGSIKELGFILPIFFVAVFAGAIIEIYLPEGSLNILLGNSVWIAIPIAAFLGVVLPIPRYVTYPIAYALFLKGASFGVVFALIAGETISESVIRDIAEIKYFGIKFYSTRMILSVIFITLGGFLLEMFL